jgi:hypothetical protein
VAYSTASKPRGNREARRRCKVVQALAHTPPGEWHPSNL